MRFILVVLVIAASSAAADTQMHRCTLEDGTVAFQDTPCIEPAAVEDGSEVEEIESQAPSDNDDFFDFVNPYDEPPDMPVEIALPEPVSQDRAECEQTTRDAIDAIDLEMRETSYTKEQGEAYLAELLALTRQLRACKQL